MPSDAHERLSGMRMSRAERLILENQKIIMTALSFSSDLAQHDRAHGLQHGVAARLTQQITQTNLAIDNAKTWSDQ